MSLIGQKGIELEQWSGRNEKPDDFDSFWNQSLLEMEELGTDAEFIPGDLQVPGAECFHVYFTGIGGARIHGIYVRPKSLCGKLPLVLQFHGLGGSAGDFFSKLSWITAGFAIAAMDCRGQGGLSEDVGGVKGSTQLPFMVRGVWDNDPRKLYYRNVFLDAAQFARILAAQPEIDETRMATFGHSQGGALSLVCAALTPSVRAVVVSEPYLCDFRGVYERDASAYSPIQEFFYRFDPAHRQEEILFRRLGYIDVQHFAPHIQAKVRWYTGLKDNTCPPFAQFAAYNKIPGPKEYRLYPEYGHEWIADINDAAVSFLMQTL